MTVEVKKPFEFKGNHVNYLHKLSKAGANALKAKFPDGNGGEVETTIQAAIEELATNGGGGSAESLIPKRVIYINPDKETVAGECYPTFAAAKTYMETYPEQKFCVELPAGDFGTTADDHITLSEQWEIHGNKTKIVAPINSNVVVGQYGVVNPSGVFISDCTVSGGFVGYHAQRDEDFFYFPVYKLNNCRITEFCSASETEDYFICVCEHCEIETTRSHNELIAKRTQGSVPYIVTTIHSTILEFGASASTTISCMCSAIRNVGAYSARFISCVLALKHVEDLAEINIERVEIANSYFQSLKSNNVDMERFEIFDSTVKVEIEGTINIDDFSARGSFVNLDSNETATIIINESWVSPDTVCRASSRVTWSATTDHTMCYIMYSTDGGNTMSYNRTGATHYGVLKVLPDESNYNTGYYMWFPMPE